MFAGEEMGKERMGISLGDEEAGLAGGSVAWQVVQMNVKVRRRENNQLEER